MFVRRHILVYFVRCWCLIMIKVITKLPNSEQSYKGKVQTHNYINEQTFTCNFHNNMLHDHMIKQTNGNIQRIVSELNISIKKNKHDFDKQTYTRTLHSNVACMMWLNKQKKSRSSCVPNVASFSGMSILDSSFDSPFGFQWRSLI
jgi:hypothetical protein